MKGLPFSINNDTLLFAQRNGLQPVLFVKRFRKITQKRPYTTLRVMTQPKNRDLVCYQFLFKWAALKNGSPAQAKLTCNRKSSCGPPSRVSARRLSAPVTT